MLTRPSLFKSNVKECCDWATIVRQFARFPNPVRHRDEDGNDFNPGWIFRGHESESYLLEPSIERDYPYSEWAAAEDKVLREFQSKARLHMDPSQLPTADDKFGWLGVIQHYGAPTRLLDFTYSPYVALYFALRNRTRKKSGHAEVWAIDAAAVRSAAGKTSRAADEKSIEKMDKTRKGGRVSFRAEDTESPLQAALRVHEQRNSMIRHALEPCGLRREHFKREGFVAVASPTLQNPRLSCQQGVFLFNGAENLTLEQSLDLMMHRSNGRWYRRFRVPEEELSALEEKLFQFNIHELSLFPDVEGLAGFVRQKIRLHW